MMTVHKVGALDVAAYANYLTTSQDEERQHAARAGTGRGDYYLGREGRTAEPLGAWWGKGAEELGLAGRDVDRAAMVRAWEGKDPSTGEILVRRGGNGDHVAAVDCTFSAPKSVSVVWALSDDEAHRAEIEAAVTRATEAALGHLERSCQVMRRRVEGQIRHEPAGGLVVSRFRHHTSRVTKEQEERGYGADPQLHDHCVIANLALRQEGREAANGRWGAIDSRELLLMQVEAGTGFRAQLGAEMQKLGYEIDLVGDHWEVRGVPEGAIREFSAREREVQAAVERFTQEHGRGPREDERRNLVVFSRGGKDPNPLGERAQWRARVQELQRERGSRLHPHEALAEVHRRAQLARTEGPRVTPEAPAPRTGQLAAAAVADLTAAENPITKSSAVFEERDLRKWVMRSLQAAMSRHETQAPVMDFHAVLECVQASPELLRLDQRHWTTREHLATERFVVDAMRAKARSGGYALDPALIERHIREARVPLDPEQAAAVRALCDRRGAALVVAEAGTGKGEVARVAAQAHSAAGRRVIALATAGETALRLGTEIGAHETHSVERFLHRVASGKLQPTANDLVVVDEAGQLETRGRWDRLLISAGDAKLVAIGDPLQLPSIEAGGLLPVLEREIGASHLTNVYRAREEWLRDVWKAIRAGHADVALAELDRRGLVTLVPTRRDARQTVVEQWDADRRAGASRGRPISEFLMVTDTSNREVDQLNAIAQGRRLAADELGAHLVDIEHTDPEREGYVRTERFHVGDRVRVVDHAIYLGPGRGRIENGQRATVLGRIGEAVLLDADGHLVQVGRDDRQRLRLGYAQHAYGAQGLTVDRVHALLGGWSTDRESGYVEATRCRERCHVVADADTLGVEVNLPEAVRTGQARSLEVATTEDWRQATMAKLVDRYADSRPKVAALDVLAARSEAAEPARSNAHALASAKQREYIAAMGGAVREGATWVEASMELDRLFGRPEGEYATRILATRLPASEVTSTIELAASRRNETTEVLEAPGVAEGPQPIARRGAPAGIVAEQEADRHLTAAPDRLGSASEREPGDSTPATPGHLDRDDLLPDLSGHQDRSVSAPEPSLAPDELDRVAEARDHAPRADEPLTTPLAADRDVDEEPRRPSQAEAKARSDSTSCEPVANEPEADTPAGPQRQPATDSTAKERSVRESQERALQQERELEAQRHAERDLDIGGMEL